MKLFTALLIANFGHGSAHPKHTALLRIALLVAGSITLTILGIHSLQNMPPLSTRVAENSLFAVWFALQCLVACVNLASSALQKSSTVALLHVLPISRAHRRLLSCLNHFMYTGLVLSMSVPIFATFLHNAGIHSGFIIAVCLTAVISGCGVFYASTTRRGMALSALLVLFEYMTMQKIIAASAQRTVWIALFIVIVSIGCLGVTEFGAYADRIAARKTLAKLYAKHLGTRFWFAKKVLRSQLIKSIVITAVFALGLTLYAQHIKLTDSNMLTFFAGLLGAACASDIRSLCRPKHPAEIVTVRGTAYFLCKEYICALGVYAAVFPLVLLALTYSQDIYTSSMVVLGSLAGVCLGLFIGTVITPYPGDISAQSTAVICSSIALLIIQKFAPHLITYCGVLIGSIVASFVTEFIRNPYTWRYYRDIKKSNTNH